VTSNKRVKRDALLLRFAAQAAPQASVWQQKAKMKIKLLVIRCKDIKESRQFYEQLGHEFIEEKHGNENRDQNTVVSNVREYCVSALVFKIP